MPILGRALRIVQRALVEVTDSQLDLVWALAGSALDLALGGRTVAPDVAEREVAAASAL